MQHYKMYSSAKEILQDLKLHSNFFKINEAEQI